MHELFLKIVPYIATTIEFLGVIVIVIAVLKSVYHMIFIEKFDFNLSEKDIVLNNGLKVALELFLSAEVLKSLIVVDLSSIIELAMLIFLRIIITVLLHWEGKHKSME